MKNLIEEAKKIISDNQYMVIATSDGSQPWISPVFMAFDEKYNFYWASEMDARHSSLVDKNYKVAIVIFDSSAPEGTGKGVYMEAETSMLSDVDDIKKIIPLMYNRKNKPHRPIEEFSGDGKRRIYKATPKKVWIKLPKESRIEIQL